MRKLKTAVLLCFLVMVMTLACLASPVKIDNAQTADETFAITDLKTVFTEILEDSMAKSIYFAGNGTLEDPYIVTSKSQLDSVATLIKSNPSYAKAYYVLENNIDMNGAAIKPWGTSTIPFKGHLDGRGYKIFNVGFSDTDSNYGLVAYMNYGSVKNVCVEYLPVIDASFAMLANFGGIVAYSTTNTAGNGIVVENCYASGSIDAQTDKAVFMGGIIGKAKADKADISIKNCTASFDIDVVSAKDSYVGGVAGHISSSSSYNYVFENCASYGNFLIESKYVLAYCGGFCAYADRDQSGWTDWVGELSAEEYNFVNCISAAEKVASAAPSKSYSGAFIGKAGDNTVLSNNKACTQTEVYGNEVNSKVQLVSKGNLESEEYLTQNLFYNFVDDWYLPTNTKEVFPRVLLKSEGSPTTLEKFSIRLNNNSGVRFYSEIENIKQDYVLEYGFIAAAETTLGSDELTFDFSGKYVSGIAFSKSLGTDIYYDRNDDITTFTGVLTGVPKQHYDKVVVLRPYLKYQTQGKTEILYGKCVRASVNGVALAIKNDVNAYAQLSEQEKQMLEDMLPA